VKEDSKGSTSEDEEGQQKFLAMMRFKRTYYTRVDGTLKITLTAETELIYQNLPLQYNS